jgi:hypothetical protein
VAGVLVGILAAGSAGASGCSLQATSSLSAKSLETMVARELATNYHMRPPAVHCPAGIPDKIGSKFACRARIDGQPLTLAGTVTGTHGAVMLHPTSAVVTISVARQKLAASLAKTFGRPVTVVCSAPPLLVAKAGGVFRCTAQVAGIRRQLVVTVTDLEGHLRYRVLPYQPAT